MSQECIKCGHDVAYHSKAAGGCGVEMMNDAGEVCGCTFDTPAAAERDKEILDWNGNEARDNKFRRWPVGDATTTVRGEQPEATMAPNLEIASSTEFDRFWKFAEEFAIDGAQRVGKWRVDEIATAYAAHVSRLSSEAIESASKEAVEGLLLWAAGTGADLCESDGPELEAIISRAIEKARSK